MTLQCSERWRGWYLGLLRKARVWCEGLGDGGGSSVENVLGRCGCCGTETGSRVGQVGTSGGNDA